MNDLGYLLAAAICGTVGGYLMFVYPHQKRKALKRAPPKFAAFAYMESVTASGSSKWHIRKLPDRKLKLGGGITTPSLCGRVTRGWDLSVPLSAQHMRHTCTECSRIYEATFRDPVY